MSTLRRVGAAPCPHFLGPQSTGRLRDGVVHHWDTSPRGKTWDCRGTCRVRSCFPATVPVPPHWMAAGWGYRHSLTPSPQHSPSKALPPQTQPGRPQAGHWSHRRQVHSWPAGQMGSGETLAFLGCLLSICDQHNCPKQLQILPEPTSSCGRYLPPHPQTSQSLHIPLDTPDVPHTPSIVPVPPTPPNAPGPYSYRFLQSP